ncbi:MAG: hypothetical protein ACI9S8_002518 [Chlamydiales bacterium]|jgi:hypothetical protein
MQPPAYLKDNKLVEIIKESVRNVKEFKEGRFSICNESYDGKSEMNVQNKRLSKLCKAFLNSSINNERVIYFVTDDLDFEQALGKKDKRLQTEAEVRQLFRTFLENDQNLGLLKFVDSGGELLQAPWETSPKPWQDYFNELTSNDKLQALREEASSLKEKLITAKEHPICLILEQIRQLLD